MTTTTMPMPPVVTDSREQRPYCFDGAIVAGLKTGDYSLTGCEELIAIERKSKADLFGSIGRGRRRFEAEWGRLAKLNYGAVVVESTWAGLLTPPPHSTMSPNAVRGTITAWSIRYNVPVFFVDGRDAGQALVRDLLAKFWKQHGALVYQSPAPEPSKPCGTRVCDNCKGAECPHRVHSMPGGGAA